VRAVVHDGSTMRLAPRLMLSRGAFALFGALTRRVARLRGPHQHVPAARYRCAGVSHTTADERAGHAAESTGGLAAGPVEARSDPARHVVTGVVGWTVTETSRASCCVGAACPQHPCRGDHKPDAVGWTLTPFPRTFCRVTEQTVSWPAEESRREQTAAVASSGVSCPWPCGIHVSSDSTSVAKAPNVQV
jgi:hypothetical protein